MHPETTIRLANMRRDELLRSARRTHFSIRNLRPALSIRTEGARS